MLFSTFLISDCWQAKSPIRTLDELSVTEVASAPYFPLISERKQCSYVEMSETGGDQLQMDDLDARPNEIFGMRRIHRCLVVTARARSFLYHQVSDSLTCLPICFENPSR